MLEFASLNLVSMRCSHFKSGALNLLFLFLDKRFAGSPSLMNYPNLLEHQKNIEKLLATATAKFNQRSHIYSLKVFRYFL